MSESSTSAQTIICLASYFKGGEFLRECKALGFRVILVTKEKLLQEDWPRESLDDIVAVPDDAGPEIFTYVVSQLARSVRLYRLIALEEYDVITAGLIREHLCLPGMTSAQARIFRDKLSMRVRAHEASIPVPDFVHVLNYERLHDFMQSVPLPWVLKPRSDVSAMGIKKMHNSEQVWRAIDELDARERLNEKSSYYLLERFVPGEVFHVDSGVAGGRVVFAGVNRYGRPPMDVAHGGGVFISHTVNYNSADRRNLLKINRRLIKSLGLVDGAAHAEFIKSERDGQFYFLEIAARVGGAYIAETLEAASGINIWREWARIETADRAHPYRAPRANKEYGGIVLSLARQEYPDTSGYTDPEIVYRVRKRYHAGLVVRAPRLERVEELLEQYARRFAEEFTAVAPPPERPT
ncbi:MAG TPA: ATP-grasp domain-containing protein [Pyrinomonadaceae bacterium]|nr:ATP-grasp domain-containing protein [Pyrinomonadaceae bacterium]